MWMWTNFLWESLSSFACAGKSSQRLISLRLAVRHQAKPCSTKSSKRSIFPSPARIYTHYELWHLLPKSLFVIAVFLRVFIRRTQGVENVHFHSKLTEFIVIWQQLCLESTVTVLMGNFRAQALGTTVHRYFYINVL